MYKNLEWRGLKLSNMQIMKTLCSMCSLCSRICMGVGKFWKWKMPFSRTRRVLEKRGFLRWLYKSFGLGVNKKGKSIKGAPSSIRDHIVNTGHSASINDFCIINTASNELDLLIHESLLILRDRPTLNQQNSSIPLCLF